MQTILGLDFGSSNVTLVKQNEGVILKEANLVSVKRVEDGYVLNCVGNKASKFLGKNIDNIMTFSPVGFGEIVSPDYATILLKRLLDSVQIKPSILNKVKLVLVIPVGLSEDAKQKYIDLCNSVKIKDVIMVPSALVSAIGENINIGANSAKLVVDIGGGVIDCAVINLNHIVCGSTLALGGRTLDSAIVEYVQKKYGVTIGLKVAQQLKENIGSLYENDSSTREVPCVNNTSHLVDTVVISAHDILDATSFFLDEIVRIIDATISSLSPDIANDVLRNGITITGGYSRMVGLEKYLRARLKTNILISDESSEAVQNGLIKLVNNSNLLDLVVQNWNAKIVQKGHNSTKCSFAFFYALIKLSLRLKWQEK